MIERVRSIVGLVLTGLGKWVSPDPPSYHPAFESNEDLDQRE